MNFPRAIGALALSLLLTSCGRYASVKSDPAEYAKTLPPDAGGTLVAYTLKEFPNADNGFYAYLPNGWETTKVKYPTIVWYAGHNGIGDSRTDPKALDRLLLNGIPKLIKNGTWKPGIPFIVLIPQARWKNPSKRDFLSYTTDNAKFWKTALDTFPIDETRMYLLGHSDGGGVAYWITGHGGDKSFFAASIPVSGNAFDFIPAKERKKTVDGMTKTPTWLFHGRGDNFVPVYMSIDLYNDIKEKNARASETKLTIFPGLGHFCCDEIFETRLDTPTEAGFDPFDQSVYEWLIQYRRIKE